MRVAMFTHRYLPHPEAGGAEQQIAALALHLRDLGTEVHVITRQDPGLTPEEQLGAVHVHRAPMTGSRRGDALSYLIFALRKAWSLQPDILHAHHLRSPTTAAVLASLLLRRPLIAKILGGGHAGDISGINRNWLGRLRIQVLKRYVDRFVVISAQIAAELEASGIEANQQVRLPNGVDTTKFRPLAGESREHMKQALGLSNELHVLYHGRLTKQKAVHDLLSAWKQVGARHPDTILLIAGSGPEASLLQDQAGAQVRFLGHRQDISKLLASVDLFVLPSMSEGLSNALLEAMASQVACIATDVEGNNELIREGVSGRLFSAGDPAQLSDLIDALLANAEERRRLGVAARLQVEAAFSMVLIASQLNALYGQLLNRERP
jgi:glycosyltransferase involved in cell wall biosynthesis